MIKNRKTIFLFGLAAATVFLFPHSSAYATPSMSMPGISGIGTVRDWVTGPLPTTAGVIVVAASMLFLSNGETGPGLKTLLRILVGIGGAIAAPNLISLAGDVVSGVLF